MTYAKQQQATSVLMHENLSPTAPCFCHDCGWVGTASYLKPIDNFVARVPPGKTVPAGQCPNCDGLAYLQSTQRAPQGRTGHIECVEARLLTFTARVTRTYRNVLEFPVRAPDLDTAANLVQSTGPLPWSKSKSVPTDRIEAIVTHPDDDLPEWERERYIDMSIFETRPKS